MKLASDDEGNAAWQFATGRRTFRKRGADFRKSRRERLPSRRDSRPDRDFRFVVGITDANRHQEGVVCGSRGRSS
jgi:hypothetical protein